MVKYKVSLLCYINHKDQLRDIHIYIRNSLFASISLSLIKMTKSDLNLTQKRPSMLGHPKYRAREERRRLLKLCQRKLRSIEDPEQILRRAVLINNTLKHLQASSILNHEEEKREAWGRTCEDRTVEEKDDKRIKEEDKSNTTSTTSSTSCYNIDDILSEIVLPPPLSPQLEDLTNIKEEERRSHLACNERLPCPTSSSFCSSPPHLLSTSSLPSSYDAVVPSSSTSSSTCSSFPPFEENSVTDPVYGFSEMYKQQQEEQKLTSTSSFSYSSSSTTTSSPCSQDSFLSDLYCMPLNRLLCKM